MAPRWIKTKDKPGNFPTRHPEDDWLMLSGGFVVGRVFAAEAGSGPPRWIWSLTGPYTPQESGARTHGDAPGRNEAMAALLANWRRWQDWAGMRDAE